MAKQLRGRLADVLFSGLNHKHADSNGDGIISFADLDLYTYFATSSAGMMLPPTLVIPSWRLSSTASIAGHSLLFRNNQPLRWRYRPVFPLSGYVGQCDRFLYGLALTVSVDTSQLDSSPSLTLYSSDFGNPAQNLMSFDLYPM
jgi:hypothetical protein